MTWSGEVVTGYSGRQRHEHARATDRVRHLAYLLTAPRHTPRRGRS